MVFPLWVVGGRAATRLAGTERTLPLRGLVAQRTTGPRAFPPTNASRFARRWRAADGGSCWQRPTAEESPLSGNRGGGWEPAGREPEQRSRNDTARRYGEDAASEAPTGYGETADSPGASPSGRDEEIPRPSRRARSRMLPETERGLLPRPGRPVRKLASRRPGNDCFRAGNSGTGGHPLRRHNPRLGYSQGLPGAGGAHRTDADRIRTLVSGIPCARRTRYAAQQHPSGSLLMARVRRVRASCVRANRPRRPRWSLSLPLVVAAAPRAARGLPPRTPEVQGTIPRGLA